MYGNEPKFFIWVQSRCHQSTIIKIISSTIILQTSGSTFLYLSEQARSKFVKSVQTMISHKLKMNIILG